jgi:hypothetical protein
LKTPGLMLLAFFFCAHTYAAQVSEYPLRDVIYDGSNPDLSVAVMGDELLETGDTYEGTKVIGFEPQAVILHRLETDEAVKCPVSFSPSPDLRRIAIQFFIFKQMKAIHEAQRAYWEKFGGVYAEDLETLVRHGFLKGFETGRKQNYFFEIVETGRTRGTVLIPSEASYLAVAMPENPESDLIFTVNRLGEVRTGVTRIEANWGPVWEYSDHLPKPRQEIIRKI